MQHADAAALVHAYLDCDPAHAEICSRFLALLQDAPDCYNRSHLPGHLTCSSWISNRDHSRAVLLFHRKLGLWLQPGGHSDGNQNLFAVALKEAREETGLNSLQFTSRSIFDLDIHSIPPHGDMPQHLHYDIRFLLTADDQEPLAMNHEAEALDWFQPNEIADLDTDDSVRRMCAKWQASRR